MTATPMTRTPIPAPGLSPSLNGRASEDHDAGTLTVANAALRSGFVLLPRTLLHAPGLSRDAKLLYAVLLSYAWQQGSCFPGTERLQHDLGCGKNQVTRYLQELEDAGLVSRRRRGQGKTTLYTLHEPPGAPDLPARPSVPDAPKQGAQTPQSGELRLPVSGNQDSLKRGAEQDSGGPNPAEHQHPIPETLGPTRTPPTLAPTAPDRQEPPSAVDDDALVLLVSQGVTRRIAQELVNTHTAEMIRQQVAWQPYRPQVKSPAGALVQAIRDAWPPPSAWAEAQEHAAMADRRAEEEVARREADEARRQNWEQKPPEERIAGRLQFWLLGQRRKGRAPSEAEVAMKRAELLAHLPPTSMATVAAGDPDREARS